MTATCFTALSEVGRRPVVGWLEARRPLIGPGGEGGAGGVWPRPRIGGQSPPSLLAGGWQYWAYFGLPGSSWWHPAIPAQPPAERLSRGQSGRETRHEILTRTQYHGKTAHPSPLPPFSAEFFQIQWLEPFDLRALTLSDWAERTSWVGQCLVMRCLGLPHYSTAQYSTVQHSTVLCLSVWLWETRHSSPRAGHWEPAKWK